MADGRVADTVISADATTIDIFAMTASQYGRRTIPNSSMLTCGIGMIPALPAGLSNRLRSNPEVSMAADTFMRATAPPTSSKRTDAAALTINGRMKRPRRLRRSGNSIRGAPPECEQPSGVKNEQLALGRTSSDNLYGSFDDRMTRPRTAEEVTRSGQK